MICVKCDRCETIVEAELASCGCPGLFARIPAPAGWWRVGTHHYCERCVNDTVDLDGAKAIDKPTDRR